MKKISIRFNSTNKVQKLKSILKKIHSKNTDQIKDIAKFTLTKNIIPQNVDHAELEIFTKDASEVITIARESLTFMLGGETLFSKVSSEHNLEGQYLVLPWNLNNQTGQEALRDLISKISSKTRAIKYTIYVNNPKINTGVTNFSIDDFSESENSITQLELSELSYAGHMEELLEKIELLEDELARARYTINENELLLEQRQSVVDNLTTQLNGSNGQVNQKQTQITNLTTQLSQRQTEITNLNTQLSQRQNQISSLSVQVNNLTNQSNNLQNQLQNANNGMYTMRLTGSRSIPGIQSYSLDFGIGGVLTFDKPIHLTVS